MSDCKTVVTKRNGYWNLLVGEKRKLHFKSKYKRDCEAKRTQITSDANKAKVALNDVSFLDMFKLFAEYKIEKANHPNSRTELDSVNIYMSHYTNYLVPYLKPANLKVAMFGVPELENLLTACMDAGIKFKTYDRVVRHIKTALRWSVSYRYATQNDIGPILNFKLADRPDFKGSLDEDNEVDSGTMIKPEHIKASLHYIASQKQDKDRKIKFIAIAILSFTGMRASEVCGLKWENVNFDRSTIFVKGTLRKDGTYKEKTKKAGSNREIWIAPKLYKLLYNWKQFHNKTFVGRAKQWVLPQAHSDKAVSYDWLRMHLYLTYEAIGLAKIKKIYNRSLRPGAGGNSILRIVVLDSIFKRCPSKCFRKFVSAYILNSKDLTTNEKKNALGHRDIKMTELYASDMKSQFEVIVNDPKEHQQKLLQIGEALKIDI